MTTFIFYVNIYFLPCSLDEAQRNPGYRAELSKAPALWHHACMDTSSSNKKTPVTIALAQLDMTVGDIEGNTQKIIHYAHEARDRLHADLVVFPELAICGYPPEDLLFRDDFHQAIEAALQTILTAVNDIDIIVGHPLKTPRGIFNAASYIRQGKIIATYSKQELPNYGVFDEKRYFTAGTQATLVEFHGFNIALTICEDLWHEKVTKQAKQAGADLIISINASPFDREKIALRQATIKQHISTYHIPTLYVATVGGQDDLVFDGGSFAMNAHGQIMLQAPYFKEALVSVSLDKHGEPYLGEIESTPDADAAMYQALVLAVKDYARKNGFTSALLGLSGGIDSALVACIAADALGAANVHARLLPSRYTANMSNEDSVELCQNLGIPYSEISIEPTFQAFTASLSKEFQGLPPDITEENLQARCRGTLLMAISNKKGSLLLATSNKSETAVGYATLYGDMAGGFSVIKDIYKTEVYRLAAYRNQLSPVIPLRIIERAPSAELAPDQKDEDSLPPYSVLDPLLKAFLEQDASLQDLVAQGFDEATVRRVLKMISRSEYKRQQAAPGPKISVRAFHKERRYPISCKFNGG